MGRGNGFPTADLAVGHLDDDKVRKLWRILGPDQAAMAEAITTHLAVVLASWGSGRRKTLDESLPIWLAPSPTVVDALVSAGLLDRTGKVPPRSWSRHYGPAEMRRQERVEAGRRGGLAKAGKQSSSGATAELYPSGRQAGPSYPSVPNRPKRATRASRGGGASLRAAMLAAGGPAAEIAGKTDGDR